MPTWPQMSHLIPKSTRLMPSSWNCLSPKFSNGRGRATLYAPPSSELQLGLGCCLKNRGVLQHQHWQRPPDILLTLTVLVPPSPPADPGAEAEGSSSLYNLKNHISCISPKTSACGIKVVRGMRPPALFVHTQTMQSRGRDGCMGNCRCSTHRLQPLLSTTAAQLCLRWSSS